MSTWQAPPRTRDAEAIYAAAEADRVAKPDRYRLDPELIVERALRGAGAAQLGRDDWSDGLAQYLGSAEVDGRLNALGLRMAADTAAGRLRARLSMRRLVDEHPDIATRDLTPPIVIIGGWRTGTTHLFRMLATDPRLHAPLPAELGAPWRMAGLHGADREAAIDAASAAHDLLHLLNPELRIVHDSGPRLAEECVLAMGTDFRNWGFTSTTRLDTYAAWLADQDLAGSYRRYRTMLQAIDERDGRRFVLKAPAHTAELPGLVAAFPGAVVVHLHRDIADTIASGASLFAVFRSTYSDHVDPLDVGRFQTDQTHLWLQRAMTFRDSDASGAATFVDVAYPDLIADPDTVLRCIYAAADLELTAEVSAAFAEHRAAHRQHQRGRHRYAPGDFGLDPDELRERFAAYTERFGLAAAGSTSTTSAATTSAATGSTATGAG